MKRNGDIQSLKIHLGVDIRSAFITHLGWRWECLLLCLTFMPLSSSVWMYLFLALFSFFFSLCLSLLGNLGRQQDYYSSICGITAGETKVLNYC